MAVYSKAIKLPNGDLVTLTSTSGVELAEGRGVVVKEGSRISCWYREMDMKRATIVRDALVEVVLDIRKAVQPDWSGLN